MTEDVKNEKVLQCVPSLGWGKNIECTFIGALDATLRYLGESIDYVYLMGISGAAFRLSFHQPEWCPSSPCAAIGPFPDYSTKAVGYNSQWYYLDDERFNWANEGVESSRIKSQDEMIKIIREEIDNGRPILGVGLISPPDWGIITGYKDGKLLCRTYYDKTEEYSVADNFPRIIFTLKKNESSTLDKMETIRESLKQAVKLVNTEKIEEKYANGFAAYVAWIKDLENEEMFSKMDKEQFEHYWHVNAWVYDSLFDARLAAANYLKKIQFKFSGKEQEIIYEVSEKFGEIIEFLFEQWVHFPFPFWVKKEEGKIWIPVDRFVDGDTWTEEMRKKGAETLKIVKKKEEEAYKLLSTII